MSINFLIFMIASIIFCLLGSVILSKLFKSKKRSAENIYKLIDDLEKKYIY